MTTGIDQSTKQSFEKGQLAFENKDHHQAILFFTKCIFLDPNDNEAYFARAESYFEICDYKSAIANYRKVLSVDAAHERCRDRLVHALDVSGMIYMKLGSYFEACGAFDEALKLSPKATKTRIHRAICLLYQGSIERAMEDINQCESDYNELKAELSQKRLFSSTTDYVLTANQEIEHLTESGSSDMPISNLLTPRSSRTAFDAVPSFGEVNHTVLAIIACVLKAQIALNHLKQIPQAKEAIQKAIDLCGGHELPVVIEMRKQVDRASKICKEQAIGLITQQKYKEAIEALTSAIELFPDDPFLLIERSKCYRHLEMFHESVNDLFESLKYHDRDGAHRESEHQLGVTLNQIGLVFAREERFVEAISYFTEAIKWDPHNVSYYVNRGDGELRLLHHEAALADYKLALDIEPTNAVVLASFCKLHNEWGVILFNQGKFLLAEAQFTKAIKYDANSAQVVINRAKARLKANIIVKALEDIVVAHKLDPKHAEVQQLAKQHIPQILSSVDQATDTPDTKSNTLNKHANTRRPRSQNAVLSPHLYTVNNQPEIDSDSMAATAAAAAGAMDLQPLTGRKEVQITTQVRQRTRPLSSNLMRSSTSLHRDHNQFTEEKIHWSNPTAEELEYVKKHQQLWSLRSDRLATERADSLLSVRSKMTSTASILERITAHNEGWISTRNLKQPESKIASKDTKNSKTTHQRSKSTVPTISSSQKDSKSKPANLADFDIVNIQSMILTEPDTVTQKALRSSVLRAAQATRHYQQQLLNSYDAAKAMMELNIAPTSEPQQQRWLPLRHQPLPIVTVPFHGDGDSPVTNAAIGRKLSRRSRSNKTIITTKGATQPSTTAPATGKMKLET